MCGLICFHGILPLGEMDVPLTSLRRLQLPLVMSKPPSDGPRLLWSQIEREVLLFLVELPKVLAGLLVDHGQHPGNRLANGINLGQFGSRSTSNFLYAQGQEVTLELSQLLGQVALSLRLEFVSLDFAWHRYSVWVLRAGSLCGGDIG